MFEEAGIVTVTVLVGAYRHVAEEMGLPRAVVTRHPMGRPIGAPGDRETQRRVVGAALELLERAVQGGSLVELPEPFRPGRLTNR